MDPLKVSDPYPWSYQNRLSAREMWTCWNESIRGSLSCSQVCSPYPMKTGWQSCCYGEEKALETPSSSLPGHELSLQERQRIFTRACRDRTKENGCKLKKSRFQLDPRNKLFTVKVLSHWKRLREAVGSPSLEVL